MLNKVLLIYEASPSDWTINEWKDNGLTVAIQYKKINKLMRAIRKLWILCNLPCQEIWYGNWKQQVKEADIIIVHILTLNYALPKYLNQLNPNARIIAWYWNTVDRTILPEKIQGQCELWTFDPEDARIYEMKFNHQYYFKSLLRFAVKTVIKWDVYFAGYDHGRGRDIKKAYDLCKEYGLKTYFQVVKPQSKCIPEEIVSNKVSYSEICHNISQSKAILEIVKEGQTGATLRVMEAVYFQKKLITNNTHVKEEEFYNENNIFVLNERPGDEILSFMQADMVPYENEIIEKYDVRQWIETFIVN